MSAPNPRNDVIILDKRCTMLAAERLFRATRRLRQRYEPIFGPMKAVAQQNGTLVLRSEFLPSKRPTMENAKPGAARHPVPISGHSIRFAAYGLATLYIGYCAAAVFALSTALCH